jgi:hypothetical protein
MQLGLTDISNAGKLSDYVPILTAAVIVDLLVMLIALVYFSKGTQLARWYKTFNLGAVITDVLILVIGILIARYIYPLLFQEWSLWKFLLLTLAIQIAHDFLFYALFSAIPRGASRILDLFKDYAGVMRGYAIYADSLMIITTVLIASFLAGQSMGVNLFILVVAVYLAPYFVYSF